MTMAICLLTADRPEYTNETLTTLERFNPRLCDDYVLLHADDGSAEDSNQLMAEAAGFLTCYRTKERRGVVPALRVMWKTAADLGASHILHLENDIRSLWRLPDRRDADSVRLYGEYKGEGTSYPTGPHIMGSRELIEWREVGGRWQRAQCHWGAQPSITRTDLLVPAIIAAASLKDVSRQLLRIDTLRPRINFVAHIGAEKTVNPRFGT